MDINEVTLHQCIPFKICFKIQETGSNFECETEGYELNFDLYSRKQILWWEVCNKLKELLVLDTPLLQYNEY